MPFAGFLRTTLIQSAELVTGMTTVLLVEACYLGCLTVSLQPGLILPDPLPTNRLGISRPVYVEEQMKPVLEGMLLDEATRTEARKRLANFRPSGNASLKVAELAYEMIGMESDREGGLCGTACD